MVGMQIVQWPMFAKTLEVVASLDGVDQGASIGGIVELAMLVEGEAVAIGSPFTKNFELFCFGVITPYALLKYNAPNMTSRGAAIDPIEPTVGTPGQMVGHRLGVLHAEAGEEYFRIGIRQVVAIVI